MPRPSIAFRPTLTSVLFFCLITGTRASTPGTTEPIAAEPACAGPLACATPTGLKATGITSTSAVISWTGSVAVASYSLEYQVRGAASWSSVFSNTTNFTLATLSPGTAYAVRVTAVCILGAKSPVSAAVNFSTCSGAPTGLQAVLPNSQASGASTIMPLSWTAPSGGAASYSVEFKPSTSASFVVANAAVTGTSFTLTGLTANTAYDARVKTVCAGGPGATSATLGFRTLLPPPTTVSTSGATINSVVVTWSAVPGATSYFIKYNDGFERSNEVAAGSGTSFTLTGLTTGCIQSLAVRAANGALSPFRSFTTPCAPATNLQFTTITSTTAALTWTRGPAGVNYQTVKIKPTSSASFTVADQSNLVGAFTFTGLLPDTRYDVQLSTSCFDSNIPNGAGYGLATASFITCGGAPTNLLATDVTATSALVSWTPPAGGAASYRVEFKPSASATFTLANAAVAGTSTTLTGLQGNTAYVFRVQATCGGAAGAFSANGTFTTGCPDAFEPNGTVVAARAVAAGTTLTATIAPAGDVDVYQFANTNGARSIRVRLTNVPANYDLNVYRAGQLLRSSTTLGTATEEILLNNARVDTYQVEVKGVSGAASQTSCYTLSIEISGNVF